jgi:tetratricopeptide (TPR) repeat protein
LYWGGGYTPVFAPYYPSFSYFGYSVVVPPPTIINIAPAGAAAIPPAPAALPANNPPAADPAPAAARMPKQKSTNAEHKARAGRFVGFGDAQFGKQKYLAALERYKTATDIAPDVAESFFRQGIANVALGQYESAARAFRRALEVRSDWNASPFRLDQLYDNAPLAKTHHLEDLAKAVEGNPFDADLLLVLGMQLFFDGQPDRAKVFFARSDQLGGNEDRLLDDLLGKPKPPGAAGAPGQGGKISF